ncbi:MAG: transposase [Anaerolineae bacterium]|nr:transposase [Anaerolineae bacterium]
MRNGEGVLQVRQDLPRHYEDVGLDEFVVMPNHVHGIVWIGEREDGRGRAGLKPAPTSKGKRHGLPEIVRGFKKFSARRINEMRGTTGKAFWQRGYHEEAKI